jgi:hypothetical protein
VPSRLTAVVSSFIRNSMTRRGVAALPEKIMLDHQIKTQRGDTA